MRGDDMRNRTDKEAAKFAGCSISTLKRYRCGFCDQTALRGLTHGCGALFMKCHPDLKSYPPKAGKPGATDETAMAANHAAR